MIYSKWGRVIPKDFFFGREKVFPKRAILKSPQATAVSFTVVAVIKIIIIIIKIRETTKPENFRERRTQD